MRNRKKKNVNQVINFAEKRKQIIIKHLAQQFQVSSAFIERRMGSVIDNDYRDGLGYYSSHLEFIMVQDEVGNSTHDN